MKYKPFVGCLVSAIFILSACQDSGKKVSVEASDEDITTVDGTVAELQKEEPKEKDTYPIDYQASVDGIEIKLEELFVTKDAVGIKSSFINNSDDTYIASPAVYSLKINSNETLGSSDIIYFHESDNLSMEGRNTNYTSVSYWRTKDTVAKDIKTIDLQLDLVRRSAVSGEGIVQFNRKLKLE
ncbi:hypothetical protein P8884_21150 [Bacillus haynesii]|nr:hypothetical protein [Bacillus haynesii]